MLQKPRFGIPSLDDLLTLPDELQEKLRTERDGEEEDRAAESYALVGLDGSGKSVLALHMASQYYADCFRLTEKAAPGKRRTPRIIYVSSDLRKGSARTVWRSFCLDKPNRRQVPFERLENTLQRLSLGNPAQDYPLELKPLEIHGGPGSAESLTDYLLDDDVKASGDPGKPVPHRIGFLDLASSTAGDDWNFVNALLAKLESIESATVTGRDDKQYQLPHLMVIDSVLGFETFVGKLDAYGVEQTRRARIAQCMRNAGSHCHLLFVVEEPVEDEHLPEEYVTDVVIRLRNRRQANATVRTLEIEKARARNHALGEQVFEIRGSGGSSTGAWENADTPVARNAYVHVFQSIAHRNALAAAKRGSGQTGERLEIASFDLPYLDKLLVSGKDARGRVRNGVRVGTCSAVIGDASTGKSSLGEKFLATGFWDMVRLFLRLLASNDRDIANHPERDDERLEIARQTLLATLGSGILIESVVVPRPEGPWGVGNNRFPITTETVKQAIAEGKGASWEVLTETLPAEYRNHGRFWLDPAGRNEIASLVLGEATPDAPMAGVAVPERDIRVSTRTAQVLAFGSESFNPAGGAHALLDLFNHPNLRYPGVLLTTSDRRAIDIATSCLIHLEDRIRREMDRWWGKNSWHDQWTRIEGPLLALLERQLIIRRFDIANKSAAVVFHVIRRNALEAKKLIYGPFFPQGEEQRQRKTNRIRLVIDDFRVLCNICPELLQNAAFLPFLTFSLERSGITNLVVYTDAVRPDRRSEDETSRALLSLLKRSILVWNVPFEGRSRVAIGVIPPSSGDTTGLVRQLSLTTVDPCVWPEGKIKDEIPKRPVPQVSRNFELYSGIEEGKPKPVPLAVYMFNETKNFEAYIEQENTLFREIFTSVEPAPPTNPGRVIFPLDVSRYLAMRDYTHLTREAQDAHTMVFQVDSSWAQKRGALEDQKDYLNRPLWPNPIERRAEDPFGLFPPKPSVERPDGRPPYDIRLDYFKNFGYPRARVPATDRIPFMWDFGFALARSAPWEVALSKDLQPELTVAEAGHAGDALELIREVVPLKESAPPAMEAENSVGYVYKALQSAFIPQNPGSPAPQPAYVSWRKFFGACRSVAKVHHEQTGAAAIAFDIAAPSSETINTLLLEVWFSELLLENTQRKANSIRVFDLLDWDPLVKGKQQERVCLRKILMEGLPRDGARTIEEAFAYFKEQWQNNNPCDFQKLPLGALCLYKAWLLLLEALNFDDYLDPENVFMFRQGRHASIQAMASRHWYKTACSFSNEIYQTDGIHDAPTAFRLPGSFSARGDWFLGSPSSSRSQLLAQQAIDLLSSRRANLTRLQMGLGLPVRDVLLEDAATKELRTALRCKVHRDTPRKSLQEMSTQLTYEELRKLGAEDDCSNCEDYKSFRWLWRPGILDYDRLSRAFQKWTARLFRWTIEYQKRHTRTWEGGFRGYDELTCRAPERVLEYESFIEFAKHCDLLVAELAAAASTGPETDSADAADEKLRCERDPASEICKLCDLRR